MTGMSSPFYALLAIAPFCKALADRYGRRLFLVINALGMVLGLIICFVSSNLYVYLIGLLVIRFVIPNDMQVMNIMECAPKKHRAKLCSDAQTDAKKESGENGRVVKAVKFIFKHKQTRNLAICALIFAAGTAVTGAEWD